VVDQVGGRLRHAPSEARGTKASPFAAQGDDLRLRAALAHQECGAAAEHGAIEEPFKLLSDEVWQRCRGEAILYGLVEGLDVVADNLVQRAALDPSALVAVARPARRRRVAQRHAGRRSRRGSGGDAEHGAQPRTEQANAIATAKCLKCGHDFDDLHSHRVAGAWREGGGRHPGVHEPEPYLLRADVEPGPRCIAASWLSTDFRGS
jgi:hypothetical protein